MQSSRGVVEARLDVSRWWVWGFVVVVVECKRVVKEGYPALWRVLAAFACVSPGQSLGEVARRPGVGAARTLHLHDER